MSFPPLWKFWRELKRPVRQAVRLVPTVLTYLFGARYYDRFLSQRRSVSDGVVPESSRTAVFVVFPQGAVAASTLRALEYLVAKGYATVVVSNVALTDADRAALLARSWKVVERTNYGYDFGAYREGILLLGDRLATLDRLVLMNDSVWFPLTGTRDWIDDAEALDVDFAGAVSNYGADRSQIASFATYRWDYSSSRDRFHYCSFALMIRRAILADPGFIQFWRDFPLTSDKKLTVRRGEIGLSGWVIGRGFSHGETLGVAGVIDEIAALGRADRERIARAIIIPEAPKLVEQKNALLADISAVSDTELMGLIVMTIAQMGAAYALAEYAVFYRGFPFLKKSPVWLDRQASDLTIDIASRLGGPDGRAILAEATALRKRRAPQFDLKDQPDRSGPAPVKPAASRTADKAA